MLFSEMFNPIFQLFWVYSLVLSVSPEPGLILLQDLTANHNTLANTSSNHVNISTTNNNATDYQAFNKI